MSLGRQAGKNLVALGIPVIITALSLTWFVYMQLAAVRDSMLIRYAEDSAERWSTYFTEHLAGIDDIFADGMISPGQLSVFDRGLEVGDAFGVKLFQPDGSLFSVANAPLPDAAVPLRRERAKTTYQSQTPIINLVDGRADPNRPDIYAEVFVPVSSLAGEPVGAMAISIDLTQMAEALVLGFRRIHLLLPLLSGLALLVPAIGFVIVNGQKRARDRQVKAAQYDPLTRVLNRRALDDAVATTSESLQRSGCTLGVLFLDVDDFKSVNDRMGHSAGDALLTFVAEVVAGHVRERDIVGRIGGDEFVVVLPGADIEGLRGTARRIICQIRQGLVFEGQPIKGTVSVGGAIGAPSEPFSQILARADDALYISKRNGRNQLTVDETTPRPQVA